MKHKAFKDLIQKLLDRDVTPEEMGLLNSHLADCNDCRAYHFELQEANTALVSLVEFFPRQGFNDLVLSKVGMKRSYIWTKAAAVVAMAWLGSLAVILLSPWPKELSGRFLISVPVLLDLFNKVEVILASLSRIVVPFARGSFNWLYPGIALVFGLCVLYFFGRLVKKEEVWTS